MNSVKFLILVLMSVLTADLSAAQSVKPAFGGNFTFKKIKPPAAGTQKRITIQIEPKPVTQPKVPSVPSTPETPTTKPGDSSTNTTMAWFWDQISPLASASGPGRFLDAVDHVAKAPSGEGIATPRLDRLYDISDRYGTLILSETLNKGLSPAFVLALISVESGGRPAVSSNKGATGLMQLIKATGERFGVTDRTDPAQNIRGGVAYLEWLMREFKGDPLLALAGYNAGEGAVRKHGGVPPYAETRAYVPKVLAAWRVTRTMCLTQPELVSDGCVFRQRGT